MYVPSHFAETRLEVLRGAIDAAGLITLVTSGSGGLDASHIPMLLEREPAPHGRLLGHLARPNGQWRTATDGSPALAIVLGPDAYVSPSWYPSKRETGRVVPTWNYVAIHVEGAVRFFDDRDRLLDVVERLTARHERSRPHPWTVADAPPAYIDGMLEGVVGVELTIARIQGKWKASQNRSLPDRLGAARGMRYEGRLAMANLTEDGPG